jgi:hypothetical protein
MAPARRTVLYHEGPEAAARFTGVMRRIVTVSKEELVQRENAARQNRKATKTPRRKKSA